MPTKPKLPPVPDLVRDIVRALDAKKAEDLCVLRVGAVSSITDWLVLATGGSEPHLRALRIEAERVFDQAGAPIAGMEGGEPGAGWTVVDAYQVMVHLFTAEQRANYALERLWRDAKEVPVADLVAVPPKPKTARKSAAKAKPTARRRVAKRK